MKFTWHVPNYQLIHVNKLPWPFKLKKKVLMVLTLMVQSVSSYSCLQGFSKWYYDLRPWKTIGVFLLSWWSIVPSCKILELMVQSVSCLQRILSRFHTMWQYNCNLDIWPLSFKTNKHFVSSWWSIYQVIWFWSLWFILYPAYNVSFYVTIRPWPSKTDLENNLLLSVILLIKCTTF